MRVKTNMMDCFSHVSCSGMLVSTGDETSQNLSVRLEVGVFKLNVWWWILVLCGQILGFDWKNCGQPDAPAVLKNLTVSPDPITIPGELTASASGSTSVELSAPLSVSTLTAHHQPPHCLQQVWRRSLPLQLNVTLEKEVAGFWVKIPCVEELGSCHYPDACDLLNQLLPPGQDCPEPLHTYGLPCHCPFKAVSPLSVLFHCC